MMFCPPSEVRLLAAHGKSLSSQDLKVRFEGQIGPAGPRSCFMTLNIPITIRGVFDDTGFGESFKISKVA